MSEFVLTPPLFPASPDATVATMPQIIVRYEIEPPAPLPVSEVGKYGF